MSDALNSLAAQIACIERELGFRRRAYPDRIGCRLMSHSEAEAELTAMEAVLATLRAIKPIPDDAWEAWRHVKRGTIYRQVGLASLQCSAAPGEGAVLVVYRGDDGKLWARPFDEFHDGRFERASVQDLLKG